MNAQRRPGVDQFWQSADRQNSGQNPVERELDERIDALARYRRLIAEAQANGRDEAVAILLRQHDREEETVVRLRAILERSAAAAGDRSGGNGTDGPASVRGTAPAGTGSGADGATESAATDEPGPTED